MGENRIRIFRIVGIVWISCLFGQRIAAQPSLKTISKAVEFYESSVRSLSGTFEQRIETTDAFVRRPGAVFFEDAVTELGFIADIPRCRTRIEEKRR